jgi:Na+:H+ antiporter, NhaA family
MDAVRPSPVDKALDLLREFMHMEAAGGLWLMATTVLALIVANSPLDAHYARLLHTGPPSP